ncbi:MAG TPA: KEOPS complex kinase/ATPase Bud32 [archaeon]|nr:KEOPS complex kinase/ATPase Bud32 [archaeon]
MKILAQGAEAVISLEENSEGSIIVKERIKKSYRIPQLDEKIRKERTSMEASLLDRARRAGIAVPMVLGSDRTKLKLEFIDGIKLKDTLNVLEEKEVESCCQGLGEIIGKLHSSGIIHGDLTTSNIILKNKGLVLIDFGLGKFSSKIEDQATDLYLLYEALNSTHSQIRDFCWTFIIEEYTKTYLKSKDVLKRFEQVAKRRRYKTDS